MLFQFVTLPDPNSLINDVGTWSSPFFNEWLNVAWMIIGVSMAALLINALIHWIIKGVSSLTTRSDRYE